MLAEEIQYETYLDGRFFEICPIRSFGPWTILSASHGILPVLLLVNDETQFVTLCLYESRDERASDVDWVCKLPPDDGASTSVFARLRPTPPTLSAGEARPLPKPDEEQVTLALGVMRRFERGK